MVNHLVINFLAQIEIVSRTNSVYKTRSQTLINPSLSSTKMETQLKDIKCEEKKFGSNLRKEKEIEEVKFIKDKENNSLSSK